jgi:hypothetical protein
MVKNKIGWSCDIRFLTIFCSFGSDAKSEFALTLPPKYPQFVDDEHIVIFVSFRLFVVF